MELRRLRPNSTSCRLNSQYGFAYVFFISFLPVLLAGFLVVLFSQFFLGQWMQSLHTCRTELLTAQKKAGRKIEELMQLNPQANQLRLQLKTAQEELMLAEMENNHIRAAWIKKEILRIQSERKALDARQKQMISSGSLEMSKGVQSVARKLRQQNQSVHSRLPDFFSFQIGSIRTSSANLAVHPDKADTAPVYELQNGFRDKQAVSVSWISDFNLHSTEKSQWITQHHKKQDSCSASLRENGSQFAEILIEAKSFLKL